MKDKVFKYKETGNLYKIVGTALMKNPVTREWQDCVIYKQFPGDLVFVREAQEFNTKFEEVND